MKYLSTRSKSKAIPFSQAITQGIAPDGGLYVPEEIPLFSSQTLKSLTTDPSFATQILSPWLHQDPLQASLGEICEAAFNFPIPLEFIEDDTAILELFHGPTSAFKDIGARFLSECLTHLPGIKRKTILVATSGDTGGAVASAFFRKPNINVVILYPKGKVSQRQELQLTTWGNNIHSFSVEGDFDDCQKMVKALLIDEELKPTFLSANSINLGRLLPQSLYYADSSLRYFRKTGRCPGFIVPTGNLGNGVAALWAKKMGFPIREVVFATNQNRPIVNYLETGSWSPHKTIATLANAMDVGNPSNMERLFHLYPDVQALRKDAQAFSVSDCELSDSIVDGMHRWDKAFCPHTAAAIFARKQLKQQDWIIVATAHPAKFETIVEPLIKKKLEIPSTLSRILSRPKRVVEIMPVIAELKTKLKEIN